MSVESPQPFSLASKDHRTPIVALNYIGSLCLSGICSHVIVYLKCWQKEHTTSEAWLSQLVRWKIFGSSVTIERKECCLTSQPASGTGAASRAAGCKVQPYQEKDLGGLGKGALLI